MGALAPSPRRFTVPSKKITKTKDAPNIRVFQFRMRADLFASLVEEVEKRQALGVNASINQVGQEWMEKGRNYDEAVKAFHAE